MKPGIILHQELEALFKSMTLNDFKWMDARDIVVAQWVRMKCRFGCVDYGKNASCPPHVPSVAECESFFSEYSQAAIFHFAIKVDSKDELKRWSRKMLVKMLDLERRVFLMGYEKAFALPLDTCNLCQDCSAMDEGCKNPRQVRPTAEALAMDVYQTVRSVGYPIQVLPDMEQEMNRYAFLLVR